MEETWQSFSRVGIKDRSLTWSVLQGHSGPALLLNASCDLLLPA